MARLFLFILLGSNSESDEVHAHILAFFLVELVHLRNCELQLGNDLDVDAPLLGLLDDKLSFQACVAKCAR